MATKRKTLTAAAVLASMEHQFQQLPKEEMTILLASLRNACHVEAFRDDPIGVKVGPWTEVTVMSLAGLGMVLPTLQLGHAEKFIAEKLAGRPKEKGKEDDVRRMLELKNRGLTNGQIAQSLNAEKRTNANGGQYNGDTVRVRLTRLSTKNRT